MGEAKRRKQLGNYPEQTKKPVRKPKRQIERELQREIMGELLPRSMFDLYLDGMRRVGQ